MWKCLNHLIAFKSINAFVGMNREVKTNTPTVIGTGIIGAIQKHEWLEELLKHYDSMNVFDEDGKIMVVANNLFVTESAVRRGLRFDDSLQTLEGDIIVYQNVFSSYDYNLRREFVDSTTYSIHRVAGTCSDHSDKSFAWHLRKMFGEKFANSLARVSIGDFEIGGVKKCRKKKY